MSFVTMLLEIRVFLPFRDVHSRHHDCLQIDFCKSSFGIFARLFWGQQEWGSKLG